MNKEFFKYSFAFACISFLASSVSFIILSLDFLQNGSSIMLIFGLLFRLFVMAWSALTIYLSMDGIRK